MAKWLKAVGADRSYYGRLFQDGVYRKIQKREENIFASNDELLTDLANGDTIIARNDSGTKDITGVSDAIDYLTGDLPRRVKVIEEEEGATGGHYGAKTLACDITHAINTWKNFDFSFPFPITIMSVCWKGSDLFAQDEVYVEIGPQTDIGNIDADVSASSAVVKLTEASYAVVEVGYWIRLADGTNTDILKRVVSKNDATLEITTEEETDNAFLKATPTAVKMTVRMVDLILPKGGGDTKLGDTTIGGSLVPANTTIRVRYKNIEGTTTDKCFLPEIQFKY